MCPYSLTSRIDAIYPESRATYPKPCVISEALEPKHCVPGPNLGTEMHVCDPIRGQSELLRSSCNQYTLVGLSNDSEVEPLCNPESRGSALSPVAGFSVWMFGWLVGLILLQFFGFPGTLEE